MKRDKVLNTPNLFERKQHLPQHPPCLFGNSQQRVTTGAGCCAGRPSHKWINNEISDRAGDREMRAGDNEWNQGRKWKV